jgi:hypothetical protein
LGLKTLNFLAQHTRHEISMLTDHEFFAEPLEEYKSVEERLSADWPERGG